MKDQTGYSAPTSHHVRVRLTFAISIFLAAFCSSRAWSEEKTESLSDQYDIVLHCGSEPDVEGAFASYPRPSNLSGFATHFEGFNPVWLDRYPELFREDDVLQSSFEDGREVLSNLGSGCWIDLNESSALTFSSHLLRDGFDYGGYSNSVRHLIRQRSCDLESGSHQPFNGQIVIDAELVSYEEAGRLSEYHPFRYNPLNLSDCENLAVASDFQSAIYLSAEIGKVEAVLIGKKYIIRFRD